MSDDFLPDSNIVLYAADGRSPSYRAIAKRLLASEAGWPVILTRVLQEVYYNARREYQTAFADARHLIVQLSLIRWITVTPALVMRAVNPFKETPQS